MKKHIPLIFIFSIGFVSCDRVKHKSRQLVSEVAQESRHQSEIMIDKVIPQFDAYKPDTEFNRKRFKEYLGMGLSSDVKDIYAYADFLGADYKILISFSCDAPTIEKIVHSKQLQLFGSPDRGLQFDEDFDWWNSEKLAEIKPYKTGKEGQYWEYLWYDTRTGKAYYESFSL